jgi:general nucleoside transport system ATP-binding protein
MPVLELIGIHRRFGSVQALRGADFTLRAGEVHALLGENGAGKTTLMHVAAGLIQPDAGTVRVEGVVRRALSPRTARRLRIGMVHQHFTSVPALTVAENVALATGWAVAPPAALHRRVRETSERVGLPLDPEARVEGLSVALRQRLEIVKALAAEARILLLDEPTAVLAPREVEELLGVVRRFADAGGAAVLITHKLNEALAATDRVTVLRRGEVVLTATAGETSAPALARAMVGEGEAAPIKAPAPATPSGAPVAILLEGIAIAREGGLSLAVKGASLAVLRGEILGIAAVEGNGQRELLRAIAARVHPLRGLRQVAEPIAFIPEDRTTEGLIPEMTLAENLVLGSTGSESWLRGLGVDWRAAERATAGLLDDLRIVAPGPRVPAASLSGGNQQRLVVGRELMKRPAVIVAENPTRGLDLRATEAIHERLRAAAAEGAAVIFHSSDLDEVIGLATRIIVLIRGGVIEAPPGAARDELGSLMRGGG